MAALERIPNMPSPWIKWPNDVFCKQKKIAGVLCEAITNVSGNVDGVVVGIGVNLNMPPELLTQIGKPATSALAETGVPVSVDIFIQSMFNAFVDIRSKCLGMGIDYLRDAWVKANALQGQRVRASSGDETEFDAVVSGFDSEGFIILATPSGECRMASGDVSLSLRT